MENEIVEMKATIDNYAMAVQNETQFREMCQPASLDEQIKHSERRAAYLRLLQFLNSRPQSNGETTAYKGQTEHLLAVIGQLQMKIQNMKEEHSGGLCVAADRIPRTTREEAYATLTEAAAEKRRKYKNLGAFFHPLIISAGGLMEKDTAKDYKALQGLLGDSSAKWLDSYIALILTQARGIAATSIIA
ncbi:hypothetical protein IFR05_013974 [Cadophora sp. M221]|nr:hypothetical protein IFR05_013974 [Cadophora sp. M221]